MDLTIEQISHVVHEANRALQRIFRDQVVSPPWLEAPASQRDGLMNGVQLAIDGASPQELHEEWVRFRTSHGWKFGPVKDEWSKRHPALVPYDQLPEEQRVKDRLLLAIVGTLAAALPSVVPTNDHGPDGLTSCGGGCCEPFQRGKRMGAA